MNTDTNTAPVLAILSDVTPSRATVESLCVTLDDLEDFGDTWLVAYVPAGSALDERVWLSQCTVLNDPAAVLVG